MLGWILLILGILGLMVLLFRRPRLQAASTAGNAPAVKTLPTDALSRVGERKKALKVIETGQTVTLLGEGGKERAVLATIQLVEMTQQSKDAPWSKTGNVYRCLKLEGDIWIFTVPSQEGGPPIWIKATELDAHDSLMPFFRGDDSKPGPARVFKNNGQSDPVPFTFPPKLHLSGDYEIVDIGRFGAEVKGENDEFSTGDFFPFVTARKRDGGGFVLCIESQKGLAQGSGGIFTGDTFEPDKEISDLL